MTIAQIQYFLEVARCKNISEAARNLYITQPTLGRQLSNMEAELNMQLMIRSNKGIRLTPAGLALVERFERMMDIYKEGVLTAEKAMKGFSGELSIAILDGMKIEHYIPDMLEYFENNYPNISIRIQKLSFGELWDGILHGTLDAVISLDVNFPPHPDVAFHNIRPFDAVFVVPKRHRLAKKESIDFSDFLDVPLAIVDQNDCAFGVNFVKETFRRETGQIPTLTFSDSMKEVLIWVESGVKCALLNTEMQIVDSPLVKVFPVGIEEKRYVQIACLKNNQNIALQLFLDYYL